jgi:hypothetical protein
MLATVEKYPDFEPQVKKLVAQHRTQWNKQLHLAVYFAPPKRPKRDVYLFEIIDGFGGGHVDPDQKLFRFAYGSTPGFPLPTGTSLQMVITNPNELDEALRDNWKRIEEIRAARKIGKATVIYSDVIGRKLWNKIK